MKYAIAISPIQSSFLPCCFDWEKSNKLGESELAPVIVCDILYVQLAKNPWCSVPFYQRRSSQLRRVSFFSSHTQLLRWGPLVPTSPSHCIQAPHPLAAFGTDKYEFQTTVLRQETWRGWTQHMLATGTRKGGSSPFQQHRELHQGFPHLSWAARKKVV